MAPASKSSKMPPLPATISMLAARPPMRSAFSSLRFRLLLAIWIPFLAAASLIAYEALERRSYAVRHSREEVASLLGLAAEQEKQGLDHARQLLATLAHVSSVRHLNAPECNALFAEIVAQHPRYANIALVTPDGGPLASGVPTKPGVDARGRAWY